MLYNRCKNTIFLFCGKEKHEKANNTGYKKTYLLHYKMLIPYHCAVYGSPDKPGGLSIQLCKSEKKELYIRDSS